MKTPIIRYYLEPKCKDIDNRVVPEAIMAEVSYGYKVVGSNGKMRNRPFRISLNSQILPRNFGKKQNNFIHDADIFKKFSRTNTTVKFKMGRFENAVFELENHYVINQMMPTPKEFKEALKVKLYGEKEEILEQTILDFLYDKIRNDESDLQIEQKKGIQEGTIKSYRTLCRHIENYQIATDDILMFSTFDNIKYWEFWRVINNIFKGEITVDNPYQAKKLMINVNGYSASSLQKHQKNLISVLRLAKKKHKLVLDLDDESLTLKDVESRKDFYVTETELQKIIDSDVSYDNRLQRAKEYTIISCLTGMRFESVRDACKEVVENYEDDEFEFKYIRSKQNKTQTEVYIPLLKPVTDILENNNGSFPNFPINQTINVDLKALFSELEINEEVTITKVTFTEGTIISKVPKCKVISTHDFKHTFYSNLYKYKVRQSVIDDITHPDKAPKNPMAKIYNRTSMLDKAKMFVREIEKINSNIYKL